jgi:hypothetical protein
MAEGGGKGKGKKIGRWIKKPCNKHYKETKRRDYHKLKHVLKSNGRKAAEEYARARGLTLK